MKATVRRARFDGFVHELRVEALCSFDESVDELGSFIFEIDERVAGHVVHSADTILVWFDGEIWGGAFEVPAGKLDADLGAVQAVIDSFLFDGSEVDESGVVHGRLTLRNAPDDYVEDEPAPIAQTYDLNNLDDLTIDTMRANAKRNCDEKRTGVACIAILPDGTRRRAILPDADPSIVVAVEGVMDAAGPVIIARADDGTTLEFHLPDNGPFISVINAQLRAAGAGFSVVERDDPAPNARPVCTGPTVY